MSAPSASPVSLTPSVWILSHAWRPNLAPPRLGLPPVATTLSGKWLRHRPFPTKAQAEIRRGERQLLEVAWPADTWPPPKECRDPLLLDHPRDLVGPFLVGLSTTDTNGPTETRVFAIASAAAASLPSFLIFLSTTAITCFLEAGICDLTWIFSGSSSGPPQRKRSQDRSTEDDGDEDTIDAADTTTGDEWELADGAGKNGSVFPSAGDGVSTSAAEEASPP